MDPFQFNSQIKREKVMRTLPVKHGTAFFGAASDIG